MMVIIIIISKKYHENDTNPMCCQNKLSNNSQCEKLARSNVLCIRITV